MNILILEKGCLDCSTVKVNLDLNKAENDEFQGSNGEKICVFFTLSSAGTKELTQRLGIENVAPILLTSDGIQIKDVNEILKKIGLLGYRK
ncbi:MAG: hypothetical protein M0P12_00440 [Paludibacteraceae bacterium]|nr:hypothetical protein [Paludibacteraceae bacterium]